MLSLFLLVGCAGDRLAFHKEGSAIINERRICITSHPGDILEYYSLSSSENRYEAPVLTEDNVAKKYSDTCIPLMLKSSTNYELIYVLGGEKYRFEFITDAHKKVTKTYSRL
ncbi:putative T6SS immunity periplasmic lipoprotein [Erwiniaceae bacterium CAU 1747]